MKEALPPFNTDAEQAVLGSCLIDAEVIRSLDVRPEDFFMEQHQWIFKAIQSVGDACNQITIAQELNKMGKLNESGGVAYLSELIARTPTSLHANYYAAIVRDMAFHRRLISAAGQIHLREYTDAKDGIKHTIIEVVADVIRFLDSQKKQEDGESVQTENAIQP